MDPERQRIQEDLRGLVAGEVRCDDVFLQLYASDASIYQIRPLGVVRPRSTADVVACVQYASENQLPIHARGAGTGLAGESLGRGIVVDFSHSMRRILAVDDATVRVQAGVVHSVLNEHLRRHGRMFGPDPAMSEVTTMGSVIAIDASGSRWLRYGSARKHIKSLQVVLADGHVTEVHQHDVAPRFGADDDLRRQELVRRLAELISRRKEQIARWQPKSRVNRCGYGLADVLDNGQLDLARMLVGSEGTLALVTEATVATEPLSGHRGVVLLLFTSLESASRAVLELLPLHPTACDLMDRRHLSLARENDVRYELLIPQQAEAVLLVEQEGDSLDEVRQRLAEVVSRVTRKKALAAGSHVAVEAEEVDFYWQLARRFVPTLYRLEGSTRPLPFVEDIAVPPEVLPDFLVRLQNTLKKHHVTASVFGHAGHGQLHVRPFLDLANRDHLRTMERLAEDLYREVLAVNGTISGEHADGLSRTPYLAKQYGPLVDVFRDVKRIFDPVGIFNPGKIVPTGLARLVGNLRTEIPPPLEAPSDGNEETLAASEPFTVPLQLSWQTEDIVYASRMCNGCGACRSQSEQVRMCPIFRFAPREEASPRAKANLVRAVLTGNLDPGQVADDEFKSVADLCVHCHMCRLECPAQVDIPKLMVECKAAFVATNGLKPTDWLMTRIDTLSALGSRVSLFANWSIANRQARWVLEKLLGIAQGRKLPRFARRSFLQWAARQRLTRLSRQSGAKVLYFVDTYANYHDPQLGQALVEILLHNGIPVYVPSKQKQSGMAMIAAGALDPAREVARHNVTLLAEAIRQGYTIVATEPSAVLCLTREYPMLLEDDDTRLVAENSFEACHYLWKRHQQGQLELDFKPQSLSFAYHVPCHVKALEVGTPGGHLLRLIPGVSIHHVDKGCSGMAGTYGLKREHYRNSLRAGWPLISALRNSTLTAGTTECSTCKMQMEQGAGKSTVHPLKIMAMAYGLGPKGPQKLLGIET